MSGCIPLEGSSCGISLSFTLSTPNDQFDEHGAALHPHSYLVGGGGGGGGTSESGHWRMPLCVGGCVWLSRMQVASRYVRA